MHAKVKNRGEINNYEVAQEEDLLKMDYCFYRAVVMYVYDLLSPEDFDLNYDKKNP